MRSEQLLEFERPLVRLEEKLAELKASSVEGDPALDLTFKRVEHQIDILLKQTFSELSPWQITLLSRHPLRPHLKDYIPYLFEDFFELHGDRAFYDDPALIGGLASLSGHSVVVVGTQKGRSTKEKVERNFGMPKPEGYRKALRLFNLAEKFNLPIITIIDTPGAFPGIDAEERGQSEAIAQNIMTMSGLKVPIISVIIGEGGSGGALAIGVADIFLMLEYSIFSVISPEGCAAILWGDQTQAQRASRALQLTADRLLAHGIIDEIVKEPVGGAHRNLPLTAKNLKNILISKLEKLIQIPRAELLNTRYDKYRSLGVWREE